MQSVKFLLGGFFTLSVAIPDEKSGCWPIITLFCRQIPCMRYIFLLISVLLTFSSPAQKINKLIKEKKVKAVLSTLAADDMQGRKPQTPGIEKAANFIAAEFAASGT